MAVDASAVARVIGIETVFKDLRGGGIVNLPQRISILAQGTTAAQATYTNTKFQITSAPQAGSIYGYGSPVHLIARELFPANGDGVGTIPVTVLPLDDDASGVAAAGDITPSGTQTEAAAYRVVVNGIRSEAFVVDASATVAAIVTAATAAINAVLEMPVIATDGTTVLDLDAKWEGTSGNDLFVEVVGEDFGTIWTITQPTGGLVNPDVQDGLDLIGDVWETIVINAMDPGDTTSLDLIQTFGDGRWGETVKKPLFSIFGNTEADVATATTDTTTRTTDKINCQAVAPGSPNLPFVVAARTAARVAKIAQNNPPTDYTGQALNTITAGTDAEQWTFIQRDVAIKAGSSTIEVVDGVPEISNLVTPYSPQGEPIPAYRFIVDIVKLQNVIFNIDLIFANDDWQGKPLIPDDSPTANPNARKPKSAVAAINDVLDSLGLAAIISDAKTAKTTTIAQIDVGNPKRLNAETTIQLSGNTNIINTTLNFGFFFGTQAVIA